MKQLFNLAVLFFALLIAATSCKKNDHPAKTNDIIYLQTNNYQDGQNAIMAWKDDGMGKLTPLTGSPFLTKGSGVGNLMQILGPLDSDYEIRISADGKYLLAVNSGSNTIAVFMIKSDGALEHVSGSPFSSGGQTPVAIDVSGNYVYVVNKSQDPMHATTMLPNYSTFMIDGSGKLTAVAGGKFETTAGTSPSNGLVSRDGKFLFATDFLGFMLMPPVGTLRSFTIASGKLTPVSGTPYVVPNGAMPPDNGALGLWQHPTANVLYVGLPVQGKVAAYSINTSTGALSLETTVAAGKAACWIRTNKMGNHMYVLNSADNTIQFYNTSSAMAPMSVQTLQLKASGPDYPGPGGAMFKTSQPFSLTFSPSENTIYVVNQHTNTSFSIGNFNYLHTLKVAADGKLSEDAEPLQIPVSNMVRPKGSAVINL